MTGIRDMRRRLDDLEERADEAESNCDCKGSSWASELGMPILLIAIAASVYGCNMASQNETMTNTYITCAEAKELTPQCRIILERGK